MDQQRYQRQMDQQSYQQQMQMSTNMPTNKTNKQPVYGYYLLLLPKRHR